MKLKFARMTTNSKLYNYWKFQTKIPLLSNWADFQSKRPSSFTTCHKTHFFLKFPLYLKLFQNDFPSNIGIIETISSLYPCWTEFYVKTKFLWFIFLQIYENMLFSSWITSWVRNLHYFDLMLAIDCCISLLKCVTVYKNDFVSTRISVYDPNLMAALERVDQVVPRISKNRCKISPLWRLRSEHSFLILHNNEG